MVRSCLLEEGQVRDSVSYFSKLQVPIILGGSVSFLRHQEFHPGPALALRMKSREAECYTEEPDAAKVLATYLL